MIKPKGWRGQSGRHRQAAKGIKTGRKTYSSNPKYLMKVTIGEKTLSIDKPGKSYQLINLEHPAVKLIRERRRILGHHLHRL